MLVVSRVWLPLGCGKLGPVSISEKTFYRKISWSLEATIGTLNCCRSACQISERSDNSKYKSRSFETLRDPLRGPGSGLCEESCKLLAKTKKTKRLRRWRRWRRPRPISELPLGIWEGTLDIREGEVMETLSRQQIDFCGVQEHRLTASLESNRSVLFWSRTANSSSSVHKPVWCWQKTLQTKLLKSSAYLTWLFFSNWSWARHFHLPISVRTSCGPNWCWKGTFLWPAAVPCSQGPSHWDTYPSWWLPRSHWRFCRCLQWCPWWTRLRYL